MKTEEEEEERHVCLEKKLEPSKCWILLKS
jgi:hypothetical protein